MLSKLVLKTMENKIKLKLTTISSASPVNVIKGEGVFRKKDEKILISHIDDEQNKTSLIITEDKIMLSRKSPFYELKMPVKQGETLLGIMGDEATFSVIGKVAEYSIDKKRGRVYLEYTLPDLSEQSTDFKVELEFEFK